MENKFYLNPSLFTDRETLVLENGSMKAYAFRYSTGVCALKVENEKGFFIILPYQGQQVWRAEFWASHSSCAHSLMNLFPR